MKKLTKKINKQTVLVTLYRGENTNICGWSC